MNNDSSHIAEEVLAKVRSGQVRMRSRTYFMIRLTVAVLVAILTFAVSTWVISFMLFSVHESGELFLLGFGSRGVSAFVHLFPWFTLIINFVLIFLLEFILQWFKFGYRTSLLSIFLGILAFSVMFGIAFDFLPVHSILLDRADNGDLPFFGEMYESIRDSHQDQGVFKGTVTSIQGSQLVISHSDRDHDTDDGTHPVAIPPGMVLSTPLYIGERIYVLGSVVNGVIQAHGIQELSPDQ